MKPHFPTARRCLNFCVLRYRLLKDRFLEEVQAMIAERTRRALEEIRARP